VAEDTVLEALEEIFGKGKVKAVYRGMVRAKMTKVFSLVMERFPGWLYQFR